MRTCFNISSCISASHNVLENECDSETSSEWTLQLKQKMDNHKKVILT